ncbi:type II toxin-antitoxin system HicB family antitoxin [Sphingomonas sp. VDB2]|uniref:type II toxin-antitoxin system HicB family antitoxin n=1 Tax=Sphingomonas sp. VDB2 TaxID=3228751 RepID=UPI003A7FD68A
MHYFYAIVHKDDDSAYGVEFPDVPGCFSAADSREDIVPNAIEALSLFFEDMPMPPDSLDSIQHAAMPDAPDGAFIIMVPYIRNTGKLAKVNLSMDRGMLDAIDSAAAMRKLTRSAFLAQAARNEIEGRH